MRSVEWAARGGMALEFTRTTHHLVAVLTDKDGLIYCATEYDWRERPYVIGRWRAEAAK